VPVLAAMLPMMLLRKLRGWRLCLLEEEPTASTGRFQFSLRQLLAWMTFMAMILGLAAWISPRPIQQDDFSDSDSWISYSIYLAIALFILTPIFLSLTGLILTRERRRRFIVFLLHFSLFFPFLLLLTISYFENSGNPLQIWDLLNDEGVLTVLIFEGTVIAASVMTLFVLRLCGYRLVRIKKPAKVKEPASKRFRVLFGVLSAPKYTLGAFKRIPPFPPLVAVLIFAAIALCWPAWRIEQANRHEALDRARAEEWKKLGAMIACVHDGEITLLTFSERPFSQEAADKFKESRFSATGSHVSFSGDWLDDARLKEIAGNLKTVWILSLAKTKITDAGLVHLQGMTLLQDLDLSGTAITDAGLKNLQGLTGLTSLNLNRTKITDAGLVHLQGMKQLYSLFLEETAVTDAGLKNLEAIPKLCDLRLSIAAVTKAGKDKLLQALPNCRIREIKEGTKQ
jgi:hypothetical protein